MTSSEGSPSSVGETEKIKEKEFFFFSARLRVDGGKKRASGTSRLGVVLATATPKSMARSRFLGRGSFRVHRTGSDCFVSFVFALKKNFFAGPISERRTDALQVATGDVVVPLSIGDRSVRSQRSHYGTQNKRFATWG